VRRRVEQEEFDRAVTDWKSNAALKDLIVMIINASPPIDGSVYATRETLSRTDTNAACTHKKPRSLNGRRAPWRNASHSFRQALPLLVAMNDEIIAEIAPLGQSGMWR
jgi:hypothetical protein